MGIKNGQIKVRRTFNEIELTAEDVLEAIEELSYEEKYKLLDELLFKYYKEDKIKK
ncbi:hypothetical protein [Priestia megaterium]|uniref:hypothetical protein n=1 Tax=Priestia megaterium TaxID=1404 RepID=UPI002FFDD994